MLIPHGPLTGGPSWGRHFRGFTDSRGAIRGASPCSASWANGGAASPPWFTRRLLEGLPARALQRVGGHRHSCLCVSAPPLHCHPRFLCPDALRRGESVAFSAVILACPEPVCRQAGAGEGRSRRPARRGGRPKDLSYRGAWTQVTSLAPTKPGLVPMLHPVLVLLCQTEITLAGCSIVRKYV